MLVAHGAELTTGHESLAKLGMIDAGPSLHRCCVVVCVAVRCREDDIWRSILDSVYLLSTAIAAPGSCVPNQARGLGRSVLGGGPYIG